LNGKSINNGIIPVSHDYLHARNIELHLGMGFTENVLQIGEKNILV
jgi:hypothetical protein